MSAIPENIKNLPVSERIQLVEDIWDSIADDAVALELSDADRQELQRRLAAHRSDASGDIPWDEVRQSLFKDRA
ncbi:MAG: addiction module protein [Rhodanobacteraceae bacterium]